MGNVSIRSPSLGARDGVYHHAEPEAEPQAQARPVPQLMASATPPHDPEQSGSPPADSDSADDAGPSHSSPDVNARSASPVASAVVPMAPVTRKRSRRLEGQQCQALIEESRNGRTFLSTLSPESVVDLDRVDEQLRKAIQCEINLQAKVKGLLAKQNVKIDRLERHVAIIKGENT